MSALATGTIVETANLKHAPSEKRDEAEYASRLMVRVCHRDVAAFEALYGAYCRFVYGVALGILQDVGSAEELTQDIFLRAWSVPGAFRGGNFGTWIYCVTRNRAVDVLRRRAIRVDVPLDRAAAIPLDDAIDELVLSSIDAQCVRTALGTLPERQRRLIELGFFGGVTHEEIARRTTMPLGTVKTRIRSGLRRLRSELNGSISR